MPERRKFRRLRYGVQVEVSYYRKKPGDTDIIRKLKTKDIGAGGIRVALRDKLEVGSLVSLGLTMPGTGKVISCFAQVAWVAATDKGEFETGFSFIDISNEETTAIQGFIETELEKGIE